MTSLSQVCVALHPFSTLAPWPPPPQVLSDSYTAGREQFFRAYLEYQKAMEPLRDLASLGVLDVDMGPLCENIGLADLLFSLGPKPSVAGPQRDEWRALLARLYHEATVCTDATRTMDLLDGAGKASKGLSSHLKGYLSHERQGELADGIKNDLRPKEGKRGGVATICGGVHYQCAEEFATTSANAKQSDCLAGVVDEDTIPVLRSFLCSGATHECFLMFDLILIPLLMACPHVRVVLDDHGCKYGKHLKALESLPAEIRDRVTTGVPMMHAEVHILRDLRHEASLLAQPYDELALKNKWSSPLQRPAPTVASRPSPGPSNAGIEVEVSGTSSDSGTPSVAADATMGTGTSSDSDTSSGSEGDSGSPGPNHSRSVSD